MPTSDVRPHTGQNCDETASKEKREEGQPPAPSSGGCWYSYVLTRDSRTRGCQRKNFANWPFGGRTGRDSPIGAKFTMTIGLVSSRVAAWRLSATRQWAGIWPAHRTRPPGSEPSAHESPEALASGLSCFQSDFANDSRTADLVGGYLGSQNPQIAVLALT